MAGKKKQVTHKSSSILIRVKKTIVEFLDKNRTDPNETYSDILIKLLNQSQSKAKGSIEDVDYRYKEDK